MPCCRWEHLLEAASGQEAEGTCLQTQHGWKPSPPPRRQRFPDPLQHPSNLSSFPLQPPSSSCPLPLPSALLVSVLPTLPPTLHHCPSTQFLGPVPRDLLLPLPCQPGACRPPGRHPSSATRGAIFISRATPATVPSQLPALRLLVQQWEARGVRGVRCLGKVESWLLLVSGAPCCAQSRFFFHCLMASVQQGAREKPWTSGVVVAGCLGLFHTRGPGYKGGHTRLCSWRTLTEHLLNKLNKGLGRGMICCNHATLYSPQGAPM